MSFANIPNDLTLPPGAPLTPGSGTVYIGSKNIPSELTAKGFSAALVFYTDAAGFASGLKYWFIGHTSQGGVEVLMIGSCDTTGNVIYLTGANFNTTTSKLQALLTAGFNGTAIGVENDIFLNALVSGGIYANALGTPGNIEINAAGYVSLQAVGTGLMLAGLPWITLDAGHSGVIIQSSFGQPKMLIDGMDGTTGPVYMKVTTNGPGSTNPQDVWNSSTTTQTIGGIAGCTVKINWRWTADYVVDMRYFVTFPTAPGAAANMPITLPAAFPTVDVGPLTTRGSYGICLTQTPGGLVNMISRIDPGVFYIFTNGTLNIATFEGSFTITVPKP